MRFLQKLFALKLNNKLAITLFPVILETACIKNVFINKLLRRRALKNKRFMSLFSAVIMNFHHWINQLFVKIGSRMRKVKVLFKFFN